jgi:hypothetical protein
MKKKIPEKLRTIRDAEQRIAHRVWEGVKEMPAKEMAGFIIQNAAEGFARGFVKEMKNQ